jgi:rfaE bifunctional protein kinase chain/domain
MPITEADIRAALEAIRGVNAVLIGDICLDVRCFYEPSLSEISRETELPTTAVVAMEHAPGGGGNCTANVAALRPKSMRPVGLVGEDAHGEQLAGWFTYHGVATELLIPCRDRLTHTFTKFVNAATGQEDRGRVDYVNREPPTEDQQRRLIRNLQDAATGADVVLVVDQAEFAGIGAITEAVLAAINDLAAGRPELPVTLDPRVRLTAYRNVIAKVNEQEAAAAVSQLGLMDWTQLARHIGRRGPLVVTRGEAGATWIDPRTGRSADVPTARVSPVDITGAGDSFHAAMALTLAAMAADRLRPDPLLPLVMGNLAAAVTVQKPGTGTASPEEILALYGQRRDVWEGGR